MERERALLGRTAAETRESANGWLDSIARRMVLSCLKQLRDGRLRVVEQGQVSDFGEGGEPVVIQIHHPRTWRALLSGGSIGVAEAYIRRDWCCDDLTALVQLFCRNLPALDRLERAGSWLTGPISRLRHLFNRNSQSGSKRNIVAHYDLSNPFYQLFLDQRMMYSSAIYADEQMDLEAAAEYKLKVICDKLQLKPGDHLLEIGTGWGGLAVYAARHYGCRVTTTTISDAQYQHACELVREEGLAGQITLLKEDYRNLSGQYDKLVSVEMIEAVGHQYLPRYFSQVGRLLKADGIALIQAITIADQRYDQYVGSVDFIQRYIFPGGSLPSLAVMARHVAERTDMVIRQVEDIGLDYARTLADWRSRFEASLPQVRELGFSEAFIRLWRFYLCYCEGGFRERAISTVHLLLTKPRQLAPISQRRGS